MLHHKKRAILSSVSRAASVEDVKAEVFIKSLKEVTQTGPKQNAPLLIRVAADGDSVLLRQLVEHTDSLNAPNENGQTPLHWVVARGDAVLLTNLLALGRRDGPRLKLDAAGPRGLTALHCAVVTRDESAASLLLKAGASVDCRDDDGQTPLMKAARWNDQALCRALLDAGAALAVEDAAGQTALHVAAAGNCAAAVRFLLLRGAQEEAVNGRGRTPLMQALRSSALAAACSLLPAGRYTQHVDDARRTELHWAAANGSERIMRNLLLFGPLSWPRDAEGMTPAMCAIQARNWATAKLLLGLPACREEDADLRGRTALHWAAARGLPWAVHRLLQAGWSAWRPDGEGRDALMLALVSRSRDCVLVALQQAGFQQRADDDGRTALHHAALHAGPDLVLALLRLGADADAADVIGVTPLGCVGHAHAAAVLDVLSCYATASLLADLSD